jgi:phosphonate transport system ATP-binding protein
MLRIKGLVKRYRTGDVALNGIDLEVPDGQVMALIGPSGAGKSTVIRCINRLVEPTAGTVMLNDTELTTLGRSDLRRALPLNQAFLRCTDRAIRMTRLRA